AVKQQYTSAMMTKATLGLTKALVGLTFVGGTIITIVFYAPLIWLRKGILVGVVLTVVFALTTIGIGKIGFFSYIDDSGAILWVAVAQQAIFAVGGFSLLALTITDLFRHRDADTGLIFLWVVGTIIFASLINWTINARSILPMAPAASIIIVRRIEQLAALKGAKLWPRLALPLIPALIITFWVTWADFQWANEHRKSAKVICTKYKPAATKLMFLGHWGFQYYMERGGAESLDILRTYILPSDLIVVPPNNTNVSPTFKKKEAYLYDGVVPGTARWLSTMDPRSGAGFYSDLWGPLPYSFGLLAPEPYIIIGVHKPMRFIEWKPRK
ncbi:MAG: hypothetical protein Q7N50_15170, partial [Armatimonadota bacterium]|nr:hypothetical protein [Armatimonadota bacterium]